METEGLYDSFGRRIRSLRISLTEQCNFRCTYCTTGGVSIAPPTEYLTCREIARFVRVAGDLGICRIRLTGGEPLLRPDLTDIVRSLKAIPSVGDLSLTTNGSLLSQKLHALKAAGLDRMNVSLDSMNARRFQEITLADAFRKVMESVFSALQAGFPVKLNMVALKGLAREEILSFVGLARDWPLEVRFLEFMPLCGEAWQPERFLSVACVRSIVTEHFELQELPRGDAAAQTFRISGGKGRVGFIGSLTESFCDRCSRIRLSADGDIRPCLFSDLKIPVKGLLRENASDKLIADAIREAVSVKPAGNLFRENPFQSSSVTPYISGPLIRKIGG